MTKKHALALAAAGAVTFGATAAAAQSGGPGIIRASSPPISNSVNEYGAEPQIGLRHDVRAYNVAQVPTRGHVRASRTESWNGSWGGPAISNSVNEYGAEPQTGLRSDVRAHNAAQVRTRGYARTSRSYAPGPFAVPGAAIGAAGAVAGAAVTGAANMAGAAVGAPYDGAYAYDDPYAANAQVGYGSQWSGHRDSRFTPGFNAPSGAAQGQHYETPIGYGSIFTSPMQ